MFGYTADEVVGHPMSMLFPPERQGEEARFLERLPRNEPVAHFETVRRRKDGREVDVSVSLSAVRDPSGRTIGVSEIARDITEAKRAAAERANLETRSTTVVDDDPKAVKIVTSYFVDEPVEVRGAHGGERRSSSFTRAAPTS